MKLSVVIATAFVAAASAVSIAPAVAAQDDETPTRMQRTWNGAKTGAGQRPANPQGSTWTRGTQNSGQASIGANGHATRGPAGAGRTQAPVPVAAAPQPAVRDNDDDRPVRAAHGRDGEGYWGCRWSREYELDSGEVARIREAHRQSDRHVTLRRDNNNDYDDVPRYYTPRRHWWHSWW